MDKTGHHLAIPEAGRDWLHFRKWDLMTDIFGASDNGTGRSRARWRTSLCQADDVASRRVVIRMEPGTRDRLVHALHGERLDQFLWTIAREDWWQAKTVWGGTMH